MLIIIIGIKANNSMNLLSAETLSPSQLVIYQTQDGKTRFEVRLDQENRTVDVESDGRSVPAG